MLSFLNSLPILILSLPAILISLSVHEAAHGYAAYKLGDPTAKNLGRLTLNPLKHINPFGFIAMLFFRIGWANPVPVNSRFFKNPRRDMAITAAAGPLSNLCLATIFTILLRLVLIPLENITTGKFELIMGTFYYDSDLNENKALFALSLIALMLYIGLSLNLNLMIFNLIPLPPLDGSRIAYIFLPTELYFKIMQYERYIMIGFIVLMATGIITLPLGIVTDAISDVLYKITGMPTKTLDFVNAFISNSLPTFG